MKIGNDGNVGNDGDGGDGGDDDGDGVGHGHQLPQQRHVLPQTTKHHRTPFVLASSLAMLRIYIAKGGSFPCRILERHHYMELLANFPTAHKLPWRCFEVHETQHDLARCRFSEREKSGGILISVHCLFAVKMCFVWAPCGTPERHVKGPHAI